MHSLAGTCFHVGGGRRIPTADILIEGLRDVECAIEIPHIAHSPREMSRLKARAFWNMR